MAAYVIAEVDVHDAAIESSGYQEERAAAQAFNQQMKDALQSASPPADNKRRGVGPWPQTDTARRQRRPRETQARVDLALGRDVGVADDIARLDGGMAADDVAGLLDG